MTCKICEDGVNRTLTFLRTTSEQDHNTIAISAKINAVSGTKMHLQQKASMNAELVFAQTVLQSGSPSFIPTIELIPYLRS